MLRRVVVTGVGLVTPLGCHTETVWERLLQGQSGVSAITAFDASDMASKIAGQVPVESGLNGLNAEEWVPLKEHKKMDRFLLLGLIAAQKALQDAGWSPSSSEEEEYSGVLIGSGIGGLPRIEETSILCRDQGPRRISPFFIPSALVNLVSGHVSIMNRLRGPNLSIVTACSSGAHAIGEAARLIQTGDAEVMVAGGTEAAICPVGIGGFAAMRALSTHFNDTPKKASRPWDRQRDGFVMGEGAGILILEEMGHAQKRGARIYGELVGYGLSADAHHATAPCSDGEGAYRSMAMALRKAAITPDQIGYINAHGTSTPVGDMAELRAVERLFAGTGVSMSSTKSAIGHLLGATGSVEAIFSLLALQTGMAPPTLNLEDPEETSIHLIANKAEEIVDLQYVCSNSFGFGGTNSTLIFKKGGVY